MSSLGKKIKLQHKIMLLSVAMVCLVLTIAGVLIVQSIAEYAKDSTADRALSIGQIVAKVPVVQQALLSDNPSEVLQPVAEHWRTATGAAFIIISNMKAIRFTYPVPEKIGTPMADLYRDPVLRGEEYVYIGKGSLNPSLRANVPIFHSDTGQQIGFVSVGFYLEEINQLFWDSLGQVGVALLVGLLFSVAGAVYLARNVKQATFGLEPEELGTILRERTAVVESLKEGVIAVDRKKQIRLVNSAAVEILGLDDTDKTGRLIDELVPQHNLNEVLADGIPAYDQEQRVGNRTIVANSVPILVDSKVQGAVITFRDRTEVNRLAEELTGVHQFVDMLRAQTHEFKNKLHTISGLIQLGRYDEAIDFATDSSVNRQELLNQLSGKIHDSVIFGLLIGKASYMREQGIAFSVDSETCLEELPVHVTSGDVVLILGNLLQNSVEAVSDAVQKAVFVSLVQHADHLCILVQNSGPWIEDNLAAIMYNRGMTTKQSGMGLGLALITEKLHLLRGSISQSNLPLGGVQFTVTIPY